MAFDGLRPTRLVVVVGTGTEVGKTYVAARLLRELRGEGLIVSARKPVQSFDADDHLTDAHVLADATGEEPSVVSPRHRWLSVPYAPPMAAEFLQRTPFTIEDLASELDWPLPAPDVGMIEMVGGVRSPMASNGDAISFIELVQPDIVLIVADAGLGTVNDVSLTLEAVDRGAHVATPIVILNRFDPGIDLHRRNREWLTQRLGAEVLVSVPAVVARLRP